MLGIYKHIIRAILLSIKLLRTDLRMSPESEPLVLYDIPTNAQAGHMPWSPNTWKARFVSPSPSSTPTDLPGSFVLNYKHLAYKTTWVELPDIAALCAQLGAPPTGTKPDGTPHYTLPVLFDPRTRRAVADSTQIARYLDETYPDTPRVLDDAGGDAAVAALLWARVTLPLAKVVVARTCAVLNPASEGYFRMTREGLFGARLEELATEEEWKKLEEGLGALGEHLKAVESKDTSSITEPGSITYSEIRVASVLVWARVVYGVDSEEWQRIADMDGGKWGAFLEKFREYEFVDL